MPRRPGPSPAERTRARGPRRPRANHAWLTINGEPYGLYTNLETVKHKMLTRWFAASTGPLFEGYDVDFVPADVAGLELEAGPDDRTLPTGLAAALTPATPAAAIAGAAGFADLARFQNFWAMTSIIGQYDSMPYSNPGDDYLVYGDPTSHRLTFIPWGMDETFYSASVDVTVTHSVLAARCHQSPACFQAYADQVWELVAMIEAMGLDAERARVAGGSIVARSARRSTMNQCIAACDAWTSAVVYGLRVSSMT